MLWQATSLGNNPFAALTAVVAPAVLTNACSVLALGTANRVARVVDRTRALNAEIAEMDDSTPGFEDWLLQLGLLQNRGQLLLRALRLFYAALGLFASAALLSIVGVILAGYAMQVGYQAVAILAIASGSAAVIALVSGCILMVHETRVAVQNLAEEARLMRIPRKP